MKYRPLLYKTVKSGKGLLSVITGTAVVSVVSTVLAVATLTMPTAHAQGLLFDPTRPGDFREQAPKKEVRKKITYRLRSVIIRKDSRLASINGKFYKEGERVAQARVVSINDDHVVLRQAGKTFTVRLLKNTVRSQ